MSRKSTVKRETKETNIEISLNLDGRGINKIETPLGFLNHMLELFSKHGLFDLEVKAKGDTFVDEHHTVEDTALVLGQAFTKALGDKKGIKRYGFFILPMDETLATVAVDFSGRYSLKFDCEFKRKMVGDFPTELIFHFLESFAQNAKINLFVKVEYGRNEHHKIEAIFKCLAKAAGMACEMDGRALDKIPSTKGAL